MEEMKPERHYTLFSYLKEKKFFQKELFDGKIHRIPPPTRIHQRICTSIAAQLYTQLSETSYEVYTALTVRPYELTNSTVDFSDTVIFPDVSVVCDPSRLDIYGCKGTPDFIVEVMSPMDRNYDKIAKFNIFCDTQAREYWVIDPEDQTTEVYLKEDDFLSFKEKFTATDIVPVSIFDDCCIDFNKVFG